MAKTTFNNIKKILTSTQLPNKLKMRVVKCYIHSVLLYGAETWAMNKQLVNRIEALEMWIYRRMGRISLTEKQTNNEVLKTLGMKREILTEIRSRQIKYFGHIKT